MLNILLDEHRLILKCLNSAGVHYILIGGFAVIAYGYGRTTGDMDVWIRPDNGEKEPLKQALIMAGYEKDDVVFIDDYDFGKPVVIKIGVPPERVDFLTQISNVSFEEADAAKNVVAHEGLELPILHLNHLVLSKFNTGRPKDIADIDELQKIEAARNKK